MRKQIPALSLTLLLSCSPPPPTLQSGTPSQANNLLQNSGAQPGNTPNNILINSGAQAGLESTQVKGQILINSGILLQSEMLLQSGAAPPSNILINSGFATQQVSGKVVTAVGMQVTATDASGKTYGPVTTDKQGNYLLPGIPANSRIQIKATVLDNPHFVLSAVVDTQPKGETTADVNTKTTAQALLVEAAAKQANVPLQQINLAGLSDAAVQAFEQKLVQLLQEKPLTRPLQEQPVLQQETAQTLQSALPALLAPPTLPPVVLILPENLANPNLLHQTTVPGIGLAPLLPSESRSVSISSIIPLQVLNFSLAVAKIEYYSGPQLLGSVSEAPYIWKWNTSSYSPGQHELRAVARGHDGAILGESKLQTITLSTGGSSGGGGGGGGSAPTPVAAPPPTGVVVPTITSLSVSNGIIGSSVIITGTNFDGAVMGNNTVKFGTTTATVTASTATTVTATVPAGISGTQNITVTVAGQTNTGTNNYAVTPTIGSLNVSSGIIGSSVIITGTGFDAATMGNNVVKFGATTATVTASTATTVTVTVPTAITGTLNITVTLGAQTNAGTNNYDVIPTIASLNVSSGAIGSSVTITGTGFDGTTMGNNGVKFGATTATVTASTATTVTATVPTIGLGIYNVTVTIGAQTNTGTNNFTVLGYSFTVIAGGSLSGTLDGVGTSARFNDMYSIIIDSAGNLFLADKGNFRIRKIATDLTVTTIAGNASGYTDGVGTAAKFHNPEGITRDSAGNLFVTEMFNHRIRRIATDLTVTTIAGNASGYTDGVGTAAQFKFPRDVARDSAGNLYVADNGNFRIRKIATDLTVTTIAGNASGYTDGVGTAAQFAGFTGMVIDSAGNLFVAESYQIRKIATDLTVTTIAGSSVTGYSDGVGTAAKFIFLDDLTIDSAGNLFVGDSQRIRKIATDLTVTTVATGNTADGVATSAQFFNPRGIAIDTAGNLFVTVEGVRVLKFTP